MTKRIEAWHFLGEDYRLRFNHWRTAVFSHQTNHPDTRHICARIDDVDPRNDRSLPDLDILLASPECTHHSNARGGQPIDDQKRATPWHVLHWTECKRPQWVIVENVREFREWGPLLQKQKNGRPVCRKNGQPWYIADKARKGEIFKHWIKSLESLGYVVDHQLLNAADFGAATKRIRLFILAKRRDVRGDIPWPTPTHSQDQWKPAHSIIDWSIPCPSIFGRKRPLADKTLNRIEAGLRKFVGPFAVTLRRNMDGRSLDDPLATITAGAAHHGLATPFFLPRQGFYDCRRDKPSRSIGEPLNTITANHGPGHLVMPFQFKAIGRNPGATKPITDPLPTIVAARENHAVMVPFLHQYHNGPDGERRTYSVDDPIPTLDTQPRYALTAPYLLDVNHGGTDDRSRSLNEPLQTLTTKNGKAISVPFLTKYYGTGGAASVNDPLDTVTTRDRFGLAMASLIQTMKELHVVDIGFRMLDVPELLHAQGFSPTYELHGNKAERVKQVGNSVSPPVAKALCEAITN